ncbi:hypothetical protein HDV00_008795 [Rhizophlyctis rosea]|nr:hypothetical protein HDV00_008795 [Rhizophlyctis rosea]
MHTLPASLILLLTTFTSTALSAPQQNVSSPSTSMTSAPTPLSSTTSPPPTSPTPLPTTTDSPTSSPSLLSTGLLTILALVIILTSILFILLINYQRRRKQPKPAKSPSPYGGDDYDSDDTRSAVDVETASARYLPDSIFEAAGMAAPGRARAGSSLPRYEGWKGDVPVYESMEREGMRDVELGSEMVQVAGEDPMFVPQYAYPYPTPPPAAITSTTPHDALRLSSATFASTASADTTPMCDTRSHTRPPSYRDSVEAGRA